MSDVAVETERRVHVLTSALGTFARYGYRKTSMEDVARDADISRPGLYFLFSSKPNLFRAAVTQALDDDVAAAGRALAETARPLRERQATAFDLWTGRYVGPMAREIAVLMETNPDLLGTLVAGYPPLFAGLVTAALSAATPAPAAAHKAASEAADKAASEAADKAASEAADKAARDAARTLLSTAAGIKHEAATREEFGARMAFAIDLVVTALECRARHGSREGRSGA